jgi:hypothetical protein
MTLALSLPEVVSPPPPHDPRDRELALHLRSWEVRLSTGRAFEYFVPRGLWHVQLWQPAARLSIPTLSRLTAGVFEAFPSRGWKVRCSTYPELRGVLAREHAIELPTLTEMRWVEQEVVDRIVEFGRSGVAAS